MMLADTKRVLVVDDNQAVHEDYRKVLETKRDHSLLDEMESLILGDAAESAPKPQGCTFQIESAYQGEEGLKLVNDSLEANDPYSVAFIDMLSLIHI